MFDTHLHVAARQSVVEGLHRYCRGIDRWDRELLMSVFHPDATVDYPPFSGNREDLVAFMWETHAKFAMHSHQSANAIVHVADDAASATAESYVTASLWRFTAGGAEGDETPGLSASAPGELHMLCARYFDRWSQRDGAWAIDDRRCVVDLKTTTACRGLVGGGRRDATDGSYEFVFPRSA